MLTLERRRSGRYFVNMGKFFQRILSRHRYGLEICQMDELVQYGHP